MDIPDLVQQSLGGEEIQAGVSLGDEDAVCLTPSRTLVYKGDGLLSDEQLEEFPHDVERIAVSEGHRKTKFTLEYFDGTRSFTVPPNRDETVLELLLEGVLRVESVIHDHESVVDIYRFSELTLIVTEGRLIRLIGAQVWNDDYEVYPFEDVTGLAFERASVATSVVIEIDGRPQRVKVPNDTAPIVRQTIETALFDYYDVASLEELNRVVDDGSGAAAAADDGGDINFGSDFDPLVTDEEEPDPEGTLEDISTGSDADETSAAASTESALTETDSSGAVAGAESSSPTDANPQESGGMKSTQASGESGESTRRGDDGTGTPAADTGETRTETGGHTDTETTGGERTRTTEPVERTEPAEQRGSAESTGQTRPAEQTSSVESAGSADSQATDVGDGVEPATSEDLSAVADRLDELTEAVDRQNELLKRQHRAIKQLVEELQSE